MKTSLEMVKELHQTFNHPVNDSPVITDTKLNNLRVTLIKEEQKELEEALTTGDHTLVLDALCDLQVVLDGAFLALGFWRIKGLAMAEVHRSNMSKLGQDGKPILREDGKFLKGPNYTPPNLEPHVELLWKTSKKN